MEWTSHLGFLCKIAFFLINVMYLNFIKAYDTSWCSSKYFSVDSRFYLIDFHFPAILSLVKPPLSCPDPSSSGRSGLWPFLRNFLWHWRSDGKKSLTRLSLLVFLHAGPFLVKLSQKKVHWFWKKLWKTITNEFKYHITTYLHHTIFAAHGLDPRPYDVGISLPCSIVKSSIVVYLDTRNTFKIFSQARLHVGWFL